MNLKKYIAELKRRNVFKAGIAYLVVAWIIAEVAEMLLDTFNAPAYIMKALLIILIIGFPINLVISWIYDITREGIKKTEEIDQEAQKSKLTGNRLNKVIIAALSVAVVLLVFDQFRKTPGNKAETVERSEALETVEISIAVLPLYNINQDEQLEYFSDGFTQEIIDELAKVNQFSLMGFSSIRKYKNTDKSSKDIAAELGVSLILTGTSRIDGDSVQLSFELVNGETGIRIWGMQDDDVFSNSRRKQNDIAKQLVAELDIELSSEEKTKLNKINTDSPEAFDLFLKAKAEYSD